MLEQHRFSRVRVWRISIYRSHLWPFNLQTTFDCNGEFSGIALSLIDIRADCNRIGVYFVEANANVLVQAKHHL